MSTQGTVVIPESDAFDFVETVSSGQAFLWNPTCDTHWVGTDGSTTFQVERTPSGLAVQHSKLEAFRAYFDLDTDDSDRYALLSHHAQTEAFTLPRGLRLIRSSDPVQTIFSFLCTPNNHLVRIHQMVRYLLALDLNKRFPDLARLADLTETELRAAGFGYRAPRIPATALLIQSNGGQNYLRDLCRTEYKLARSEVMTWPGVGPKVADCILLYAFQFQEAVPVDTHLWQAVCKLWRPDWSEGSLTFRRYCSIGDDFRDRFGKHAGWAQLQIYRGHQIRNR